MTKVDRYMKKQVLSIPRYPKFSNLFTTFLRHKVKSTSTYNLSLAVCLLLAYLIGSFCLHLPGHLKDIPEAVKNFK